MGEVGELWVRGPNIMKGYYRAPEETAAAINSEGWFNTRDLARFEDGNLFIVGRTKDLIIRFGFNVYPAEVEAVLNAHPAVVQSAVIGRTTQGNEEILAFVQASPDSRLLATDLAEYAATHLAAAQERTTAVVSSVELFSNTMISYATFACWETGATTNLTPLRSVRRTVAFTELAFAAPRPPLSPSRG